MSTTYDIFYTKENSISHISSVVKCKLLLFCIHEGYERKIICGASEFHYITRDGGHIFLAGNVLELR
jgi:hypothetical protein